MSASHARPHPGARFFVQLLGAPAEFLLVIEGLLCVAQMVLGLKLLNFPGLMGLRTLCLRPVPARSGSFEGVRHIITSLSFAGGLLPWRT